MKHPYKKLAKNLRQHSTDAERKLWYFLRRRQLVGFRFRRQVPLGTYIVDFLCFEPRIIVELDGGQHNSPQPMNYDDERTLWLQQQGYRVIRFWNHDVLENSEGVLEEIRRLLSSV